MRLFKHRFLTLLSIFRWTAGLAISLAPSTICYGDPSHYLNNPPELLARLLESYRSVYLIASTSEQKENEDIVNTSNTLKMALTALDENERSIITTFNSFHVYLKNSAQLLSLFQIKEGEKASDYRTRLRKSPFKQSMGAFTQSYHSGKPLSLFESTTLDDLSKIPHAQFSQHFLGLIQLPMRTLAELFSLAEADSAQLSQFFRKTLPIFRSSKCVIHKTEKFQLILSKLPRD